MLTEVLPAEFETRLKNLPRTFHKRFSSWSSLDVDQLKENVETVLAAGIGSVEALLSAFNDEVADKKLRLAACNVLCHLRDKEARPALEAALRHPDEELACAACFALGKFGDKQGVWALLAAAKNPKNPLKLRQTAITALGHLESKHAVLPLVKMLDKNQDIFLRRKAAQALGQFCAHSWRRPNDERAIQALLGCVNDPDEDMEVCREAASWLGRSRDGRVVEPLLALLENKEEDLEIRRSVVWALSSPQDHRATAPLLAVLQDNGEDAILRSYAAYSLGYLTDASAVEPLLALLQSEKDASIRAALAHAVGWLGSEKAVLPLLQKLNDPEETVQVRDQAAHSLGQLGDSRALEPLLALLKDERPELRLAAVGGLRQLCDERAIAALEEVAAHDEGVVANRGDWGNIREQAADAIDYIKRGGG